MTVLHRPAICWLYERTLVLPVTVRTTLPFTTADTTVLLTHTTTRKSHMTPHKETLHAHYKAAFILWIISSKHQISYYGSNWDMALNLEIHVHCTYMLHVHVHVHCTCTCDWTEVLSPVKWQGPSSQRSQGRNDSLQWGSPSPHGPTPEWSGFSVPLSWTHAAPPAQRHTFC